MQIPKSKRHPWKESERLHDLQIRVRLFPSTGGKI